MGGSAITIIKANPTPPFASCWLKSGTLCRTFSWSLGRGKIGASVGTLVGMDDGNIVGMLPGVALGLTLFVVELLGT